MDEDYGAELAEKVDSIKKELKASGLWSDKQIDALHLFRASSPEDGKPMRGLSTYNAEALLGISYKTIQAYCSKGKVKSDRDILGSRVIPVEEIIRLKKERMK